MCFMACRKRIRAAMSLASVGGDSSSQSTCSTGVGASGRQAAGGAAIAICWVTAGPAADDGGTRDAPAAALGAGRGAAAVAARGAAAVCSGCVAARGAAAVCGGCAAAADAAAVCCGCVAGAARGLRRGLPTVACGGAASAAGLCGLPVQAAKMELRASSDRRDQPADGHSG